MEKSPLFVRHIEQKDNHTFTIEWQDQSKIDYRLHELQKHCPCANCVDETTGKRIAKEETLDPQVKAIKIVSVGRYALRIQFTSGCSSGIYGFDTLYHFGKK